jgi:hypothetical protein
MVREITDRRARLLQTSFDEDQQPVDFFDERRISVGASLATTGLPALCI